METAQKRILFRPGDAVAILLVLMLAGVLLWAVFTAKQGNTVEISVEGKLVATLSLAKDTVYPIESRGYHLTVHIENGEVFVTDADCPDLVCEHTGKIFAQGTSIVCAAAGVSVNITGGGDRNVDFIAG
ncbi:MAG: NusG domain II-containing protein [Clostridia bacterium]|nr:NusG domain II-containing protein [Clostridia bacterium]